MRTAVIRQRARVARAWARTDIARTPRQARKRLDVYREARLQLTRLLVLQSSVVTVLRDHGRCPHCHRNISLAEAENYR